MGAEVRNLVESWLAVKLAAPGMSVAQAVRDLNDELGTAYEPQRLYEWRRGSRSIPEPVQNLMMRESILHALREAVGVDLAGVRGAKKINQLVDMLTPPARIGR